MNAKLFIVVFLALALSVAAQTNGVKNLVTNQPPAKVSTTAAPENLAVSCTFSGDPHVKTSFNAYYDFYAKGDYLLAQYNGVKVYGRFNHVANWPGRSVTTAVSVHVGNMRATYYSFDRQLKLNGQNVPTVTVGKKFQTKSKNLVVTRIGDNKYVIEGGVVKVGFTINGNHNPTDPNRYLDVEIFSSRKAVESPEYKGLCSKLREQILGNFEKPIRQITKFHKLKEHSKRRAKKFCHKLRHDAGKFHACVSDYVAGGAKLAQSTLDLEKNKDEIRTYYAQSETCREKLREFAQLNGKLTKTNPRDTATVALIKKDIELYSKKIIPKACEGKRRSNKCKAAQKAYSKLAEYYNKLGESASPVQRNSIYKILQGLGAKSRQICDIKGAINRCRKNRKITINTLNANLATIQVQIKKVQAQIKETQNKKCKIDLSALKKFENIRWAK